MIKLEAHEMRGNPILNLQFNPQCEQFSPLGESLIAFVKYIGDNYEQVKNGTVSFSCSTKEAPTTVAIPEEPKKPLVEYKDVSVPTKTKEEEVKIEIPPAEVVVVEEVKKPKKKKVEMRPASI